MLISMVLLLLVRALLIKANSSKPFLSSSIIFLAGLEVFRPDWSQTHQALLPSLGARIKGMLPHLISERYFF